MLTEIEMKVINLIYSLSCKSFTIPFSWSNGSISLKQNQNIVYNFITWVLLILSLALKVFMVFQKNNINEVILNGLFLIVIVGNIIFQLTICLYQTELVQLINQTLLMNSCWGTYCIYTECNIIPIASPISSHFVCSEYRRKRIY